VPNVKFIPKNIEQVREVLIDFPADLEIELEIGVPLFIEVKTGRSALSAREKAVTAPGPMRLSFQHKGGLHIEKCEAGQLGDIGRNAPGAFDGSGFDGRLLAPEIVSFFGAGAADLGAVNDKIL
jgi:hypothetical protein